MTAPLTDAELADLDAFRRAENRPSWPWRTLDALEAEVRASRSSTSGRDAGFRETLSEAERLLVDVSPDGCGGYGDFPPEGGWDAWEDRYKAWRVKFRALSPVESPGEERPRADLAEIERLVSKYGRAIVYGGNGLKAQEARATLLSAIRSLAAPREVEEVRKLIEAAREVVRVAYYANGPNGRELNALRAALARLSSPSGEAPERGDGEGRS